MRLLLPLSFYCFIADAANAASQLQLLYRARTSCCLSASTPLSLVQLVLPIGLDYSIADAARAASQLQLLHC